MLAVVAVGLAGKPATVHASGPQQGVDVSCFQYSCSSAHTPINWSQVANAGVSFAYIRAGEGITYQDPDFQGDWNGAMAAGVTPGAYLFFHPSLDPHQQASNLINQLHSVSFVRGDLIPAIDVETTDNQPSSTIVANLQTVVSDVSNAIGEPPAIYASPYWWDDNVGSSAFTSDPLWVACWQCGSSPAMPANNWGGYGYQAWQWTDNGSVPGITGVVDQDAGNPVPPLWDGSGSFAGTHFAPLDTSGNGSGALMVTDDRIYSAPSTKSSFGPISTWYASPFYGNVLTTFADIDGLGKPSSAIAINNNSIYVLHNQSGSAGSLTEPLGVPLYGNVVTTMADLDGSGRASAVAINSSSIWVSQNTGGTYWGQPAEWSNAVFYGSHGTFMADIDGTGRASAVAIDDNSIWVMRNLGNGSFGPPMQWSSGAFYGYRSTFMADVTGTGFESPVALNGDGIWVEPNIGGTLGSPQEWTSQTFYGTWNYMADIDGSGRASAIAVSGGSIWVQQETTMNSFGPPQMWLYGAFYGTH